MKTLFQIKETLAGSVKRYGRVLSLIVALTAFSNVVMSDTYYLLTSSGENDQNQDNFTVTKATAVGVNNIYTFNFTAKNQYNNYYIVSTSSSASNYKNPNGATFTDNTGGLVYHFRRSEQEYGQKYSINIDTKAANTAFVMTYNSGTNTYTLNSSTPTPTGDAPVVYWAAYPTMGMNTVNLYGHLHSRDCNTITGAGFYWSTSHINDDAAKAAIEAGTDAHIVQATSPSPATIGSLVAGGIFSAENVNINLEESRSIYLVNYAKTAEGGIGISDEVALSYDYCDPMEEGDLTLNDDNVKLPQGAKFKFEAIAHNAGKSPVFEWKDNGNIIEDATADTLVYEMPDTQTHTIRVTVLGRCGNTDKLSVDATVTLCDAAPSVAFDAEVLTATTPWVSVPITITATNVTSAEWSVTPETAELSELTSTTGGYTGTFRAPVAAGVASTDYFIEVKGKNNTCIGSVEAVAQHKITVTKDEDTCNNPE